MENLMGTALDAIAIACCWLACLTLYRRLGNWRSVLLLASMTTLLLVSVVGVWALGAYINRPFADERLHGLVLAFGEHFLPIQFALILATAIAFLLVSLSVGKVRRPE